MGKGRKAGGADRAAGGERSLREPRARAAPGGARMRDRAARLARGGLDAAGFVRSPFTISGKQRLFAEPPHMQASMLFLPDAVPPPEIGDEVDVRVRFTATDVDRIVFR